MTAPSFHFKGLDSRVTDLTPPPPLQDLVKVKLIEIHYSSRQYWFVMLFDSWTVNGFSQFMGSIEHGNNEFW